MEFFATAAHGTEGALREELWELHFKHLRQTHGGVAFSGEWEDGCRACLQTRIAQRIQMPLATFPAQLPETLYAGVRNLDWSQYLTVDRTLAVSAFCHDSTLHHTQFVALKTKDAIVDQLRDRFGARPSVNADDPDVHLFIHLVRDVCTVYLDLAGVALFKRGYRTSAGDAPLKETLAAAMLRLVGWDRSQPLFDPLCGSGTIAIEAALWAGEIAPGLFIRRFGFERWANHDAAAVALMAELRSLMRTKAHGQFPRIIASDRDPAVLALARANARAAGVRLAWREADVTALEPGSFHGVVVTNPPYGKRLAAPPGFHQALGGALCRLHGCRLGLLAGSDELLHAVPLKPVAVHELYNGDLPCQLLVYDVP